MDLVEATREDVPTVAAYWHALATEMERYDELNELAVDGPADAEPGVERHLDREDTTVYLLRTDDEDGQDDEDEQDVEGGEDSATVGYLLLRAAEHPSRVRSSVVDIVDLFVDPEHRGRGYGSDAVTAVKERAAERGADYVTVSCEWPNDDARRFYEDNGFAGKQVTYAARVD